MKKNHGAGGRITFSTHPCSVRRRFTACTRYNVRCRLRDAFPTTAVNLVRLRPRRRRLTDEIHAVDVFVYNHNDNNNNDNVAADVTLTSSSSSRHGGGSVFGFDFRPSRAEGRRRAEFLRRRAVSGRDRRPPARPPAPDHRNGQIEYDARVSRPRRRQNRIPRTRRVTRVILL